MARPPITLTEDQVREVETLAALLTQDQIADYFGIARNTFRAICARDEAVLAHYKRGKAKAIAHVANGLLQRARAGDNASAIFYLKTQAGWRETRELHHGADAQDAEATDLSELSDDELLEYLDLTQSLIEVVQKDRSNNATAALPPMEKRI